MAPSFPEPIKTIVIDLIKTIITELKVDFSEKLIMTRYSGGDTLGISGSIP